MLNKIHGNQDFVLQTLAIEDYAKSLVGLLFKGKGTI